MGYYQIEIAKESKKYTVLVTSNGHYELNSMPFLLVNDPAVFQTLMIRLIENMIPSEVLAYLDDIIIPRKTVKEGIERHHLYLKILKESGLALRLNKCSFLTATS